MDKKIVVYLVVTLFISTAFLSGIGTAQIKKTNTKSEKIIKINNQPNQTQAVGRITKTSNIVSLQNLVMVVITSPEDGAVVTDPHLIVLGYATDEAGMNYWEWEWHYKGGSHSNSSYFETAEYVEFRIDIHGLQPGWNLVIVRFKNIYGVYGEDSVNVTYNPPDEEPPQVTIESPENGAIFTHPHITVTGVVTDNAGIFSIGAKHRWEDGETETSSTIPPTTYFPFEWDFELYEGWNEITIYAEDLADLYGEDVIEVWYYPEQPEITFYQLDLNLDDMTIKDSSWGQAIIQYEHLAEIIYVNLEVNDQWVVQNLPILPVDDEILLDFNLGVEEGEDINSVEYAYDITLSPVSSYNPSDIKVAPVFNRAVVMASGEIGETVNYIPMGTLIGWLPVDYAFHDKKNITNQDCGISECVPAAISNSLKFLKKRHKMTDSKMEDANISIAKMKTATGWSAGGAPASPEANAWWNKKKKYMEDNDYPITTTIHKEDVKMDDIIKEIKKGQDIELRVPGHAAMIVGIIKHANGKYTVSVAHDINQSNPGGTVTQHTIYDPSTGKFTGGTWINGKKLSRIIVECPKENKPPNKPAKPSGPTKGKPNKAYSYSSSTTDPDNDNIFYMFTWGDGTNSGWLGPYASGSTVTASHTWTYQGDFEIRVKAKDTHGAESEWSDILSVSMPRSRIQLHPLLLKFFEGNSIFPRIKALLLNIKYL